MSEVKRVYKKKISVVIDFLATMIENNIDNREEIINKLKKRYEETGISPFRGLALPEDIYDKEMATLYIVGKYGMGIEEDYPDFFEKVFRREKNYEIIIETLLDDNISLDEKRNKILGILGGEINSNELSRVFRITFTKIILGFEKEEKLVKLLHRAREVFPELERDINKYAKFYIGFRLAEKISTGEIKDKVTKEAQKQALNLTMGLGKTMPDDNYIYNIAKNVFRLPKQKLLSILNVQERKKEQRKKNEDNN